jgi:4,5-DOPA dioxygenase extradiol
MPLFHMLPAANVPLLELPMPLMRDPDLFAFGRALAPLRKAGIMILTSGTMTHNLAAANAKQTQPAPWTREFDAWYVETAAASDIDGLINWRKALAARLAHPDDGGHYRVSLIALGAALGDGSALASLRYPLEGFDIGHFSTRSVQFA